MATTNGGDAKKACFAYGWITIEVSILDNTAVEYAVAGRYLVGFQIQRPTIIPLEQCSTDSRR